MLAKMGRPQTERSLDMPTKKGLMCGNKWQEMNPTYPVIDGGSMPPKRDRQAPASMRGNVFNSAENYELDSNEWL